MKIYTAVKQ